MLQQAGVGCKGTGRSSRMKLGRFAGGECWSMRTRGLPIRRRKRSRKRPPSGGPFGRGLTLLRIWPRPTRLQGEGHSSCYETIMADRYLEAVRCLNRIAPERFAEALDAADARAGLRSFQEGRDPALMEIVFSVPDEQFWWFRLVLRKIAEKYERHNSIMQTYRKLNSPRS